MLGTVLTIAGGVYIAKECGLLPVIKTGAKAIHNGVKSAANAVQEGVAEARAEKAAKVKTSADQSALQALLSVMSSEDKAKYAQALKDKTS